MKCSVIIAVLDSHEVVRRQLQLYRKIVPAEDFEVIIVDDGSDDSIYEYISSYRDSFDYKSSSFKRYFDESIESHVIELGIMKCPLKIIETHDKTPWSQPRARNKAAKISKGEYLMMTDIDHIFTKESMENAVNFTGDKMKFPRRYAVLDEFGNIVLDKDKLIEYGCTERDLRWGGCHENTFIIRKTIFCDMLNGYDDKFNGKHGGDDTDLSRRYAQLHYSKDKDKKVKRHTMGAMIYVYPNPNKDVKRVFHHLRHRKK